MRKNKLEGKIPGSGAKRKGRSYITLYLNDDLISKIKEIKAISNDFLNEKLKELLK